MVAFVAGVGMLLWAGKVGWAAQFADDPFVPAVVAGALALIGIVLQTYLAFVRKRPSEEDADESKAAVRSWKAMVMVALPSVVCGSIFSGTPRISGAIM